MAKKKKTKSAENKAAKHVNFSASTKDDKEPTLHKHGIQHPGAPSGSGSGALSKGQLAALILLSMGVSRLLQVGGAAAGGKATVDGDGDATAKSSEACIRYLGEAACGGSQVQTLLHYKFFLGIQCALLALATVLQCWKQERLLMTLDTLFIVSPISTFAASIVLAGDTLKFGAASNLRMSAVLIVVALPYDDWSAVPFLRKTKAPHRNRKSFQSLALITLAFYRLMCAGQIVFSLLQYYQEPSKEKVPVDDLFQWNRQHEATSAVVTNAILYFVVSDHVSIALIYLFAWYHLSQYIQRVCINGDTELCALLPLLTRTRFALAW